MALDNIQQKYSEVSSSKPVHYGKKILKYGLALFAVLALGGGGVFGYAGSKARQLQDEIQRKQRIAVDHFANYIEQTDFSQYFNREPEKKDQYLKEIKQKYDTSFERFNKLPDYKKRALALIIGPDFINLLDEKSKKTLEQEIEKKGQELKTNYEIQQETERKNALAKLDAEEKERLSLINQELEKILVENGINKNRPSKEISEKYLECLFSQVDPAQYTYKDGLNADEFIAAKLEDLEEALSEYTGQPYQVNTY